ncbi:hypothetical protein BH23VER1_BH23VER1_28290 [soil metagenome]
MVATAGAVTGLDGTFADVLASYGTLSTVAGNGDLDDGNDWQNSAEGNSATFADLSRPHMAVADAYGNIYIADKESHAIRKVRTDGTIVTVAGATPGGEDSGGFNFTSGPGTSVLLDNPNGVFAFPDGTLYIVDLGNDRICRLDTSGHLTTVVTDPAGISSGRGLWVSPDEKLIYYSSRTVVRRWTAPNTLVDYSTGYSDLGNIDVDPDGNLCVTDRNADPEMDGAHRVWRIHPNGARTVIAGNGGISGGGSGFPAVQTGLEQVRGIAFDEAGGFFLCTHKGGNIWYVDTSGIIHLVLSGKGSGNLNEGDGMPFSQNRFLEKLSEPRAVALAPDGDLLITTNDQGYVRKIQNIRPPIAPKITTIDHDPITGTTLRWQSNPDTLYHIDRAEGMGDGIGAWSKIGEQIGVRIGSATEFNDPDPPSAQAFYRIRVFKD